jgi:hypothetical protein
MHSQAAFGMDGRYTCPKKWLSGAYFGSESPYY